MFRITRMTPFLVRQVLKPQSIHTVRWLSHLSSTLPDINGVVSLLAGTKFSPSTIAPFKSTPSVWGESYLITVEDKKYVARITTERNKTEMDVALATSTQGVSPTIHHFDPKNNLMIMDYVVADNSGFNKITDHSLSFIGKLLKNFSNTPIPASLTTNESYVYSHFYQRAIQHPDTYIKNLVLMLDKANEKLASSSDNGKLMHGDFHNGNLLYDGDRFFIIDFEFSKKGSPLIDVGTLSMFLNLSMEQEKTLLSSVCDKVDENIYAHYLAYKELAALRYAILFAGRCDPNQSITPEQITSQLPNLRSDFNISNVSPQLGSITFFKHAEHSAALRKQVLSDGMKKSMAVTL